MVVKKTWTKDRVRGTRSYRYAYTGWFLLGIIPIYVDRILIS